MKAGRRRNRQSRKHRAARVNWTPLPIVGKTMTANSAPFHEFKSEYQSGLVEKSQSYIALELDCPSYDFRDIDISPTCLGYSLSGNQIVRLARYVEDGLTEMLCERKGATAYVFKHNAADHIVIIFKYILLEGYNLNATMAVFKKEAGIWKAIPHAQIIFDGAEFTHMCITAERLLKNRTVDYVQTGGGKRDKSYRVKKAGAGSSSDLPKVIHLHETRTIGEPSGLNNSGRHHTYSYEVKGCERHYKTPIKHGPNAGKTKVVIAPHKRCADLPAKASHYRVKP